jgi:hypothetical protein
MDARTLAARIVTLSRTLGVPPAHLGRERFKSLAYEESEGEHASVSWALWNEAKALASAGVEAVPPRHVVKGVSTLVAPDGSVSAQWIKTREAEEPIEDRLARLFGAIPDKIRGVKNPVKPPSSADADLLAVYPFGDPHIGMLAWAPESGASWDLAIAERTLVGAVRDLVRRGPPAREALIVSLGDTFHADNVHGRTAGGNHSLDLDGRHVKVLQAGLRIFVALITTALERHERVKVDILAGNHDTYTAAAFAIALAAWFRSEPRVTVPVDPALRHYHRWGQVLLGTVHGDRARPKDLPEIMAAERPQDWGETRTRAWYVGHVHHSTVQEHRGVTVETFRTLAARDAWHAAQGYQSGRDLRRITYHRAWGEVHREICSLDYLASVCQPVA